MPSGESVKEIFLLLTLGLISLVLFLSLGLLGIILIILLCILYICVIAAKSCFSHVLVQLDTTTEKISEDKFPPDGVMISRGEYVINQVIDYLNPCGIEGIQIKKSFGDKIITEFSDEIPNNGYSAEFGSHAQEDLIFTLLPIFSQLMIQTQFSLYISAYRQINSQWFLKSVLMYKSVMNDPLN